MSDLFRQLKKDEKTIYCKGSEFQKINSKLNENDKVICFISFDSDEKKLKSISKTKNINIVKTSYNLNPNFKRITILDEKLPELNKLKENLEDFGYIICSDLDILDNFYHNNSYDEVQCICTFENISKYNSIASRENDNMLIIAIKNDNIYFDTFQNKHIYEYDTSIINSDTIVQVYDGFHSQYYKHKLQINKLYMRLLQRYVFIYLDNGFPEHLNPLFTMKMFDFEASKYSIADTFNELVQKHNKKKVLSSDTKYIGNGAFNIVYDSSIFIPNSVVRIRTDDKDIREDVLEIIKNENPKGIVKIYDYSYCYSVNEKLHEIENIDDITIEQRKIFCDNIQQFFKKHKNISFLDFHWGNFMLNNNNQLTIADIDFGMVDCNWLNNVANEDLLKYGSEIYTGFSPFFKGSFLKYYMQNEINEYNLTVLSICLWELANYESVFIVTAESLKQLKEKFMERMKK